jgi:hypothetical protein
MTMTTTTPRERLAELLDTLADDQIETILGFVQALSRGRAVVSTCDVVVDDAAPATAEVSSRRL